MVNALWNTSLKLIILPISLFFSTKHIFRVLKIVIHTSDNDSGMLMQVIQ